MQKNITDIELEADLQNCTNEKRALLILKYSRQLKKDRGHNTERSPRPILLRTYIVMVSTFLLAFSLMLSMPKMIFGVLSVVPYAFLLGTAGEVLAQIRGIRSKRRFLTFVMVSLGLSTALIAPFLIVGASHNLYRLAAASFLYGATQAIFSVLVFGSYGVRLIFQKPQRQLAGV